MRNQHLKFETLLFVTLGLALVGCNKPAPVGGSGQLPAGWKALDNAAATQQVPTSQQQQPTPETDTPEASGKTTAPDTSSALPVVTICIDPGHPSENNDGLTKQNGLTEQDINWEVSLKLKSLLDRRQIRVVMTKKEKSTFVKNKDRARVCNAAGAALFIRLHCDTGRGSGYTLYYPDREATKDGRTGPSSEVRAASEAAAVSMDAGMAEILAGTLRGNGIKGDSATYIGGKQGALTGSIFSDVPTVTVEMVFLSNPADAAFIGSPEGQGKMAEALACGIEKFLQGEPAK